VKPIDDNSLASSAGRYIEQRLNQKSVKKIKSEATDLKNYYDKALSPEREYHVKGSTKLGSREPRLGNKIPLEIILGDPSELQKSIDNQLKAENKVPNARLGSEISGSTTKLLGTSQILGCQGDFCDFDLSYFEDQEVSTDDSKPNRNKYGNSKTMNEFRRRLVSSTYEADFIVKDSTVSKILQNTDHVSSRTITSGKKKTLRPIRPSIQSETDGMYKIPYRSIIQGRQEMPLVKLQLDRYRKNEDGPYFREDTYADLTLSSKLPSHYYQDVPVCAKCFKVYKLVDEARGKAMKQISLNNNITITDSNSKKVGNDGLSFTSYQQEQLSSLSAHSSRMRPRLHSPSTMIDDDNTITDGRSQLTMDVASQAIRGLTKMDIAEIRTMTKPHAAVEVVMEAVMALLTGKVMTFKETHRLLGSGDNFLNMLRDFDISEVTDSRLEAIEPYVDNPLFTPENVQPISLCASKFCAWIHGVVHTVRRQKGLTHRRIDVLQPIQQQILSPIEILKRDPISSLKTVSMNTNVQFNRGVYNTSSNNNNKNLSNNDELTFIQKLEHMKASKASDIQSVSRFDADTTGSMLHSAKGHGRQTATLRSVSRSVELEKIQTNSMRQTSTLSAESGLLTRPTSRFDPASPYPSIGTASSITGSSNIHSSSSIIATQQQYQEPNNRKLTKRESKAVSTMQKKATDRLSSLNVTEGGAGVIGSPKIFRCSDGITKMPYVTLGSFSLNVTRCNFIVIHDFFDTCDATAILFKPIAQRHEGCQIFCFNYPGQAHTVWPRLSIVEKDLGAKEPIINNDWIADRLHELLQSAEQQGDFLLTNPFHLVGIGNGACIAASFCQRWGRDKTYEKGLRSVVSINGFLYPDPQLSSILHSAYQVFESAPHSRPDIPVSYWSRFVFSEEYLSRINPNLALNIYTAVSNPITNDGRVKITRGCLQHRDMRGSLSPDYKPVRSDGAASNQHLPIQVPVIMLQSTENTLVNASNVDSFLYGRNSKHLWSHMLNIPSETLLASVADSTALWVGKLSTGPVDYHKCSSLGRSGLKMVLESLRSPRGAFCMWTRTGHAVAQEYKAALLDLIDVLACPTDEYVGLDIPDPNELQKQKTLAALTNGRIIEDDTPSQRTSKLMQETEPPVMDIIFEMKPRDAESVQSSLTGYPGGASSIDGSSRYDEKQEDESMHVDEENGDNISEEATVQDLLKNLGYTKLEAADRRIDGATKQQQYIQPSTQLDSQKSPMEDNSNDNNNDTNNNYEMSISSTATQDIMKPVVEPTRSSLREQPKKDDSYQQKQSPIPANTKVDIIEVNKKDDVKKKVDSKKDSKMKTGVAKVDLKESIKKAEEDRSSSSSSSSTHLKPSSMVDSSTTSLSKLSTSPVKFTSIDEFLSTHGEESVEQHLLELGQKEELKPKSPSKEFRPRTTDKKNSAAVKIQDLYGLQPPDLPPHTSASNISKITRFADVADDDEGDGEASRLISHDDYSGNKLIKGIKQGLEHTYISNSNQKRSHEWSKSVPDAVTALELEAELRQKQQEYLELEARLKLMRTNEDVARLGRIDQAQESRRKQNAKQDQITLGKLKSEIDDRQRERDFAEKQRRLEARAVEKALIASGVIPPASEYERRPVQEMIPLHYELPQELPSALLEGLDIVSKLDRMKRDEEIARKRGIMSIEDYEKVKREMQERQLQRDQKLRNLTQAEKNALYIACTINIQKIVRGKLGRNRFNRALGRRKLYLLQIEMAIKIQSVARGRRGRKRFKRIKELYLNNLKNAFSATDIQRVFRGYIDRKYFKKLLRWMSALKIQRLFRGYLGRLAYRREKNRVALINAKNKSAAKIQSIWRMKVAKEEFRSLRIHVLASIEIQRAYRGYMGRKVTKRRKLWESTAPGPDRIKLGLTFIEESKQAFERQQEEIDALHRAQERAEARVSHIHAELKESEKELVVLERELQEIDQIERDLNILTQERDLINQGIENAAGMPRLASKGHSDVVMGRESTKDNDPIPERRRKAEAYALEMTIQLKRSEREKKRQELELEFAAVFQDVEKKKKALERLELSLTDMEATRERKDREFRRMQRNLMQLLMEQKQELDDLREKGIELETATATTAAAAVATAQKAKEHEQRSTAMFSQTEELMKFQFMSMSLSYFSSLNMLKSLRDMNADTTSAAIALSADASSTAASVAAAANLPNMKKMNLGANDFMSGHVHKKKAELAASQEAEKEFKKLNQNPVPDNVRTWTVSDVTRWLDSLSLGQYIDAFSEGAVDGPFLMELREEDLVQVLGVKHKLHVRKILTSREKLKPLSQQELKQKQVVELEEKAEAIRNEFGVPTLDTVFSQARNGRIKRVQESLNAGFPVDAEDERGNTLLLVAAQNSNKRLVEMLLVRGAAINHQNAQGNTALHFAIAFDSEGKIGEYLIEHGADDTIQNVEGLTAYDGVAT